MAADKYLQQLSWPLGPMDLLAKAVLAPESEARIAWAAWREAYDIDKTPWNQVRMLGSIAPRLVWLEPSADIAAWMRGIQKFLWVQTELSLRECAAALQVLRNVGIPTLFLKGLTRLAHNPEAVKERLISDVDVLVPFDMHEAASKALIKAGWVLDERHNPWQAYRRKFGSLVSHHAWSYVRNGVEFDLHHFSNYLNRNLGDDEGLWERSTLVAWRGHNVLIPSPTDCLLLALVHGARLSSGANADWTIDACVWIESGKVQWQILLQEAHLRMIEAPVLASLRYLHEGLQRPVPQDVIDDLASRLTDESVQELWCYTSKPEPALKAEHEVAAHMAARRAGTLLLSSLPTDDNPLFWNSTQFKCRNQHEVRIDVPPLSLEGETLLLRVHVTCESSLDGLLAFTIGIKGLYFFWEDMQLEKQQDGLWGASTNAALPRALIIARGISGLVLRAECPWLEANGGPELSFEVETLLV